MKQIYSVRTAELRATPPDGRWHAVQCPGTPAWSLVVVLEWHTPEAEAGWEARASVTEHYPENLGGIAPPALVTAFGPCGVVGTDTVRQALRKIRAHWPALD
jgi:hypothetical protein